MVKWDYFCIIICVGAEVVSVGGVVAGIETVIMIVIVIAAEAVIVRGGETGIEKGTVKETGRGIETEGGKETETETEKERGEIDIIVKGAEAGRGTEIKSNCMCV